MLRWKIYKSGNRQPNKNKGKPDVKYGIAQAMGDTASGFLRVIGRCRMKKKLECKRDYRHCWVLPFMVYIDAKGNLWPCIVFMGKEEMKYGNINERSFVEIWEGMRRKKITEYFMGMDLEKNCRELCRLDEMNRYLDKLKHPGGHVNFI